MWVAVPVGTRRESSSGNQATSRNAPSPAAELGLSASIQHPSVTAQQNVPPSDLRPPAPIIRPRPMPMPEPEPVHMAAPEVAPPPAPMPISTPAPAPASEPAKDRSFASLFGWKKSADEPVPPPAAKPVTDEEGFDDELEIPAFLRRQAD